MASTNKPSPNNKSKETIKDKEAKAVANAKSGAQKIKNKAKSAQKNTRIGKQIGGFSDFIRTQGVVGLAIGLAIGTQAGATVKIIVEGFVNPIVGFILGSQQGLLLSRWYVIGQDTPEINYLFTVGSRTLIISWGAILSSVITLVAVAAVVYFVVKSLKLDKLDKKKD